MTQVEVYFYFRHDSLAQMQNWFERAAADYSHSFGARKLALSLSLSGLWSMLLIHNERAQGIGSRPHLMQ
jgi:hypothetical protein